MREQNIKEAQYGPCGLYCGACSATECDGCRSDKVDEYVANCKFRSCSKDKHVEFCCFCDEYPCEELHNIMNDEWPHHWTMEPNLQFIKTHGKEKWLESKKSEWSCKSCGHESKWYQNTCNCGQKLKAWKLPESKL